MLPSPGLPPPPVTPPPPSSFPAYIVCNSQLYLPVAATALHAPSHNLFLGPLSSSLPGAPPTPPIDTGVGSSDSLLGVEESVVPPTPIPVTHEPAHEPVSPPRHEEGLNLSSFVFNLVLIFCSVLHSSPTLSVVDEEYLVRFAEDGSAPSSGNPVPKKKKKTSTEKYDDDSSSGLSLYDEEDTQEGTVASLVAPPPPLVGAEETPPQHPDPEVAGVAASAAHQEDSDFDFWDTSGD